MDMMDLQKMTTWLQQPLKMPVEEQAYFLIYENSITEIQAVLAVQAHVEDGRLTVKRIVGNGVCTIVYFPPGTWKAMELRHFDGLLDYHRELLAGERVA